MEQQPRAANPTVGTVGKLKIFFGYGDGVGKTYAMLQQALQAKRQGADVVVGWMAENIQPQTRALLDGLETLKLERFDIDAALQRHPQLLILDEFARCNPTGSRHTWRVQDVQELLAAGIDVYTTLNVQQIESLTDTVSAITGVAAGARVPDSAFDQADGVELVDIEPRELLDRLTLQRGVCPAWCNMENLTALRELALRRCADRVHLRRERAQIRSRADYHTDEHILVCVSSSPTNAKIIRTAARMAQAFRGRFTALYVQTAARSTLTQADQERLRENMHLAKQLGAAVETVQGEDVPYQIAEFARLSGVSKIVIGRSTATRKSIFGKPALTERLIAAAPNLDVHIIPDASATGAYRQKKDLSRAGTFAMGDLMKSGLALLGATGAGWIFYRLGIGEANIVAVYIFAVLVLSMIASSRLCGPLASLASVFVFNFCFTQPRFTLHFDNPDYWVTFAIMFLVALFTGSLVTWLKENAQHSAHGAFRTKILFETSQLLQKQSDEGEVVQATAGQLSRLLRRDLVFYLAKGDQLGEPVIFPEGEAHDTHPLVSEKEQQTAAWVLRNNHHAGATTDTLAGAKCLYLAIRVNQSVYGVVGIAMEGILMDSFENSVLLSILGECALALENIKNAREKEAAAILAKNEQLRANLLRSISHDLRTPLTSIAGNAGNLLANYAKMDDASRAQTFSDIYDDSMWLINLVENLLAVTRIEDGRVKLNQSMELMDEVVTEALRHINRHSREHVIRCASEEELLLAHIDAKLIVQVLINLVDNAIKYTPVGSTVTIHTRRNGPWAEVSVADDGPGIPKEQQEKVFDMFYCGANRVADSRRSLGLGLALCKTIVTAHGGRIWVEDNRPHGAVFTFTLPAGEVELHE